MADPHINPELNFEPPNSDDGFTFDLEPTNSTNPGLANHTLIGKIISHKVLNRNTTKTMILKGWGQKCDVSISDIGPNCYLFHFNGKQAMKKVIREAPWNVMGLHLSIQPWAPEISLEELSFSLSPFWIQIHGLPIDMMTVSNAAKIGSRMGTVLRVKNPTIDGHLLRSFIRIRILININHPLITGCWVPRKNLPKAWISFKYEQLMDYCYNCENGESNVSGPSPTMIDLNSGLIQPGLGPIEMEDIQFTKEDFGLKEAVITFDYQSPKRNGSNAASLMDLEISGSKYIWSNNRRGDQEVKEKIDRVLTNFEWRTLYPHAEALAVPPISSDHTPIILDIKPEGYNHQDFKFEAYWQDHDQCQNIIQESWKPNAQEESHWDQLLSRVKNCSKGLSKWSKSTFKQANREIFKLKKKLMELSNDPPSDSKKSLMEDIRREIDKLWKQEEKFWEGTRNINDCLNDTPKLITPEINARILDPVTRPEILNAVQETQVTASLQIRLWDSPGKYLGMPAEWGRSKGQTLSWIKEKVLKGIYFPETDFMHCKKKRGGSWSWNSILQGRQLLKDAGLWQIGDGKRISIAEDRWLPNGFLNPIPIQSNGEKIASLLIEGGTKWDIQKLSQRVPSQGNNQSFDRWLWGNFSELKSKGNYSQFLMANFTSILWAIWKGRNDFIFRGTQPDPIFTVARANSLLELSDFNENAGKDHRDQTWKQHVSKSWRPPQADAIKINCDAAFKAQSQLAAIAAIVRDSSGVILSLSSKIVPTSSPLLAEALAVREAVLLASGTFWPRILVESDSQVVIEALKGGNQHWEIDQVTAFGKSPTQIGHHQLPIPCQPPSSYLFDTQAGNTPLNPGAESLAVGSPFEAILHPSWSFQAAGSFDKESISAREP
ncbi:Ribonuclease H-like superfamily [Sesbania bispinosa]|nr:Ribonuclease H-like superfamily [Sesbania bispinosa]